MDAMQTPQPKVSFKEQMHQAREDAILQSACRLLGEKAFDAMTMDDVANAVGIAKASLYKHFCSKEELCSAAMVQILGRVQTYLAGLPADMPPLEKLHARYRAQGFAVLGFPSGDFREQEFTDEKDIQEFCTLTYGVRFPMFEKVHVVGNAVTPLYRDLAAATGVAPGWNFHKYLVGRDGKVIANWGSRTTPDDPAIVAAIEQALKAPRSKPKTR